MPAFSIGDCLRFGWETFKSRPWILIVAFLFTTLVQSITGILFPGPEVTPRALPPPLTVEDVLVSLAGFVISVFATLGWMTFNLRAHDDIARVDFGDLWNPSVFWRFLGVWLLFFIIVFFGVLLLIVPGIIAAIGFGFAPYLVIDRGKAPVEALKESWRITKGYKWPLLLFGLALIGLNLLGLLALVVGLLVTLPVTALAITHAYRWLQSRTGGYSHPASSRRRSRRRR